MRQYELYLEHAVYRIEINMSNNKSNNKPNNNKSNNKPNNNKSNNNKSNNNKPNNNNRFQILVKSDENTDNKLVKNDKILSVYNSSNNSFTKSSNNFDRPRNNRIDDTHSKNNFKQKEKEPVKIPEIVLTPDIFPELLNTNTNISQVLYSTNFKDILTKVEPEIHINKNTIKPGFVEMTVVDRKIVTKYGTSTPSVKKNKAIEERSNNVDYCMNKVIIGLEKIWNNRKDEYDSINGEGSYDELYYLPQVYGPEYDNTIEDEEEDEINPYDEYIYEDEYIE